MYMLVYNCVWLYDLYIDICVHIMVVFGCRSAYVCKYIPYRRIHIYIYPYMHNIYIKNEVYYIHIYICLTIYYLFICFSGGLIGVVLYEVLQDKVFSKFEEMAKLERSTLDSLFKAEYYYVALPLAVCIGVGVFFFEQALPWAKDLSLGGKGDDTTWFTDVKDMWPPYVAGIAIGAMQLGIRAMEKTGITTDTAFASLTGLIMRPMLKDKTPPHLKECCHKQYFWQMFFLFVGVPLGAFLGALSTDALMKATGPAWYFALGGGVLVLLGSRLANGCPLTHAVTGMSELSIISMICLVVNAGSAVGIGLLMKHFKLDPASSSSGK